MNPEVVVVGSSSDEEEQEYEFDENCYSEDENSEEEKDSEEEKEEEEEKLEKLEEKGTLKRLSDSITSKVVKRMKMEEENFHRQGLEFIMMMNSSEVLQDRKQREMNKFFATLPQRCSILTNFLIETVRNSEIDFPLAVAILRTAKLYDLDLEATDEKGVSPFSVAVEKNLYDLVELFLELDVSSEGMPMKIHLDKLENSGFTVETLDKEDVKTPEDLKRRNTVFEVIQIGREMGCDCSFCDHIYRGEEEEEEDEDDDEAIEAPFQVGNEEEEEENFQGTDKTLLEIKAILTTFSKTICEEISKLTDVIRMK